MISFVEPAPEITKVRAAVTSKKCGQALERIIEASRQEFIAIGPGAAKIECIAVRANLTRQAVYYYYKNTREIFYDIVLREVNMLVDRFKILDNETLAPEAAIRQLFLGLIENADHLPILTAFVGDPLSLSGDDKKAKRIFADTMQQVAKRLQVLLDRGAEKGTLRPGVDAARFFTAACMITSGAKNSRHAMKMMCEVDVDDKEGMKSWQVFAVDLLMRSISTTN